MLMEYFEAFVEALKEQLMDDERRRGRTWVCERREG